MSKKKYTDKFTDKQIDCISRENAIAQLTKVADTINEPSKSCLIMAALYLKNKEVFPSTQPKPKRADWKLGEIAGLECTNCGWELENEKEMTNYCPSCGCLMGYQ